MRRTDANGNTTRYAYDAYGNRASMTYPDGKTVKYTYDELNRLVKLSGLGESVRYGYNAKGQRTETRTDKLTTKYAYDAAGNLVSQSTTGAYDLAFEYDYDKAGRITQESRTENGAPLTSDYEYDKLGQLTGFERSDGYTESYVYDPVGNMLSKTRNGVRTDYTYNAANQLVSDGENKYTYDKNGNLVQKGNTKYTYNAQDLLESWTDGEHSESYTYNANRLLSSVTNDEGTTSFDWDILTGDGVVIEAESGGDTTDYLYGLERIAALNGKNKTEYAYDGRGSVAAELRYTDAWYTLGGALSNADVTSKSYTPFGEQIGEAVSGFGYNGEYYNADTGMVYLRARFYEPEMNRFSQKDIVRGGITVPNSLNRYTYVQNDPLNLIDPSGESLKSAWNSAKTAVKNAWTATKTAVSNAATSVKNWATNTWNKLTNKSSAPAVTPPAPTPQRNTSSRDTSAYHTSDFSKRGTGYIKNTGISNYQTLGVSYAAQQQYYNTYNRSFQEASKNIVRVDSINGIGINSDGKIICGINVPDSDVKALQMIAAMEECGVSSEKILKYVDAYIDKHTGTYITQGKTLSYYNIDDITAKLLGTMILNEEVYATFYFDGEAYPANQLLLFWERNLMNFKQKVQNKGDWDLKQLDEWQQSSLYMFNGEIVDKDAPGNIMYGYMGKAYGIPDIVLYAAAGYAQISAGTSKLSFWNSFFDDPMDQDNIRRGIEIYETVHGKKGEK